MIKKISALVLAGAMALSLAACGAEDKVTPPGGNNAGTSASGTSSASGSGLGRVRASSTMPDRVEKSGSSSTRTNSSSTREKAGSLMTEVKFSKLLKPFSLPARVTLFMDS